MMNIKLIYKLNKPFFITYLLISIILLTTLNATMVYFYNYNTLKTDFNHAINDINVSYIDDEMLFSNNTNTINELNEININDLLNPHILQKLIKMPAISYNLDPIRSNESSLNQTNFDKLGNTKPAFKLIFYDDMSSIDDFISGNRLLIEGAMIDNVTPNMCLISDELARKNNLKVGSVISFSHYTNWNVSIYYTISGIYKDYTYPFSNESYNNDYTYRRNEIISNLETINKDYFNKFNDTNKIPLAYQLVSNGKLNLSNFKETSGVIFYDYLLNKLNQHKNVTILIFMSSLILYLGLSLLLLLKIKHTLKIIKPVFKLNQQYVIKHSLLYEIYLKGLSCLFIISILISMIFYSSLYKLVFTALNNIKETFAFNSLGSSLIETINIYAHDFPFYLLESFKVKALIYLISFALIFLSIIYVTLVILLKEKPQLVNTIKPIITFEPTKKYLIYDTNKIKDEVYLQSLIFSINSIMIIDPKFDYLINRLSKKDLASYYHLKTSNASLILTLLDIALANDVSTIFINTALSNEEGTIFNNYLEKINYHPPIIVYSQKPQHSFTFDEIWQVKNHNVLFIK